MQEIMEEYGEFIIEMVSGALLLGIIGACFLGTPMTTMVYRFITSVMGGGA